MDVSVSSGGPRWQPSSEDPGEDPPGIHGGSSTKSKDPCVSSTAKIGGSTETTCPYIILIKGRHGKLLKSCFLDFCTVGSSVTATSRTLQRLCLPHTTLCHLAPVPLRHNITLSAVRYQLLVELTARSLRRARALSSQRVAAAKCN
jgi:hypothetical protein